MEYIFFYRYNDGSEGFAYYYDQKEANERLEEFKQKSEAIGSVVEFGIAEIERTISLNMDNL